MSLEPPLPCMVATPEGALEAPSLTLLVACPCARGLPARVGGGGGKPAPASRLTYADPGREYSATVICAAGFITKELGLVALNFGFPAFVETRCSASTAGASSGTSTTCKKIQYDDRGRDLSQQHLLDDRLGHQLFLTSAFTPTLLETRPHCRGYAGIVDRSARVCILSSSICTMLQEEPA